MIEITHLKVTGFEEAIRGMRNPMNSWGKSDSCSSSIGPNDLKLMKNLVKSGPDHAKFLRMIHVSMDIRAPLYWWKEFDAYKVGTVANSCSTMHTIHKKEFTIEDFSCEKMFNPLWKDAKCKSSGELFKVIITELNILRDIYLKGVVDGETGEYLRKPKDKEIWYQMIQLLPSSYNQLRTISTNYEVLRRMYYSRKDHKLDEWREFCEYMKDLPVCSLITMKDNKDEYTNLNPTGTTRIIAYTKE